MQTYNPLIPLPPYHCPRWLVGGHLQTVYAKLLARSAPHYRRELLPDSTGKEQVAYDFIDANHANSHTPLVVLFHGLEGSSRSHYAIELMHTIQSYGWHGVVAHFRSCGGVPAQKMYHSGDTLEVEHMLNILAQRYTIIYTIGVSLGGNVLAKYLGEQGLQGKQPIPHMAAIISAPLNLTASSEALQQDDILPCQYFNYNLLI